MPGLAVSPPAGPYLWTSRAARPAGWPAGATCWSRPGRPGPATAMMRLLQTRRTGGPAARGRSPRTWTGADRRTPATSAAAGCCTTVTTVRWSACAAPGLSVTHPAHHHASKTDDLLRIGGPVGEARDNRGRQLTDGVSFSLAGGHPQLLGGWVAGLPVVVAGHLCFWRPWIWWLAFDT